MKIKTKLFIFITIIAFVINCGKSDEPYTIEIKDGVKYVHNHAPLWGDTLKVELEFVQKIGDLDTEDENYQLFLPTDVARDTDGNIYVLDAGNYRIQKFDSNGDYVATIGRQGQGPGEMLSPISIRIDAEGNLYVSDAGNNRIQVYDTHGRALKVIKQRLGVLDIHMLSSGEIVINGTVTKAANVRSPQELQELNEAQLPLVDVYNQEGKLLRQFGEERKYDSLQLRLVANLYLCTSDRQDNIYLTFIYQNRIEKFSPDGKIIFKADRKLGYKESTKYEKQTVTIEGRNVVREYINNFSVGTQVDRKDRLWVQTITRQPVFEEEYQEKAADLFYLEIYSNDGILLSRIPMPPPATMIIKRIYNDRVYFVETFSEMCVYEYKIIEKYGLDPAVYVK